MISLNAKNLGSFRIKEVTNTKTAYLYGDYIYEKSIYIVTYKLHHNYKFLQEKDLRFDFILSYVAFTKRIADSAKSLSGYGNHHIDSGSTNDTLKWEPKVWVRYGKPVRFNR